MFSAQQIIFILFSIIILGAAIRVVTCHRIFHASMWLIVAFLGVASVYMLLDSPFLAGIQLFIYIGGVAVLTVIAIMGKFGYGRCHFLYDGLEYSANSLARGTIV